MRTIQEMISLRRRTAVITGGCGHIGMAMAEALAECGASLALVDRLETSPQDHARNLEKKYGITAIGCSVDLAQEDQLRPLPAMIAAKLGGLDILINNAAFVGDSKLEGWVVPFERQSTETWRKAFEVNLTAVFTLCREAVPFLERSGHGSIINFASIYGVMGPDMSLYEGTAMGNPAAYAASKGGLIQFTRWLATVLAPKVRVNAVSPGGVWRSQPEAFHARYIQKTPLARMAVEEDFKGIVLYLASDLSAYVTGQNFMVDGGFSVW